MFEYQLKKLIPIKNYIISKINLEPITIDELLIHYKSQGIIGEEQLLLQQTFTFLGNQSFGIIGKSGSGKTKILESMLNYFPHYQVDLSSELVSFYDSNLKKSDWLYLSELQRAGKTMQEILKNITDGKPIKRIITSGKEKQELTIPAKNVCFTLATENSYKMDTELRRRFLILKTDESEEQTKRILSYTQNNQNNSINPKRYLNSCINLPVNNNHTNFLLKGLPLNLEMRSFFPQLKKVVEGYTRFNHKNREIRNKKYISTVEDNEFIKKLFKLSFLS